MRSSPVERRVSEQPPRDLLASKGARIMVGDINAELGMAIAQELGTGVGSFQPTDVREIGQVDALIQAAVDQFGRLDILFNNAGIGSFGQTPDMDADSWHAVIDIDLNAVFYGCRAAIPHLRRAGGGSIINTASISGMAADYGLAAYNAAKGAVINYTRALAIDHARENIRANVVCPGAIDTPLVSALTEHPATREEYGRLIPMGRLGKPEEIATVVVFLASEEASYVNGAVIAVDGGLIATTGQPNFTRIFGEQ